MEEFAKALAQHFETQVGPVGAIFMVFTVVLYLDIRAMNKALIASIPVRTQIDTLVNSNIEKLLDMVETLVRRP